MSLTCPRFDPHCVRSESLTPSLVQQRGMRPALYVDMDVDIYISAYQALDWLCAHRLIRRGTILGYDDWLWGVVVDHGKAGGEALVNGEARAHEEVISKRYGLKVRRLAGANGQGGAAFTVKEVPW